MASNLFCTSASLAGASYLTLELQTRDMPVSHYGNKFSDLPAWSRSSSRSWLHQKLSCGETVCQAKVAPNETTPKLQQAVLCAWPAKMYVCWIQTLNQSESFEVSIHNETQLVDANLYTTLIYKMFNQPYNVYIGPGAGPGTVSQS